MDRARKRVEVEEQCEARLTKYRSRRRAEITAVKEDILKHTRVESAEEGAVKLAHRGSTPNH